MSATPISSLPQAEISNQQRQKQKNSHPFGPFDLSFLRELCDPQEKFALERIKLTRSTGFMVVWVEGLVRPTALKLAANQRCKPVPAASLFLVVFAHHSGSCHQDNPYMAQRPVRIGRALVIYSQPGIEHC